MSLDSNPTLSIVVPVYKEALNIDPFLARANLTLISIAEPYEIIFILDPSPDDTEYRILLQMRENPNIKLLKMSRRFGQAAATMAGLAFATGQRIVVIDVDLQDPPELIIELNSKMNEGFDVVYATRRRRQWQ